MGNEAKADVKQWERMTACGYEEVNGTNYESASIASLVASNFMFSFIICADG
jgi:hypothetical protein